MAANGARRTLQFSSASARTLLARSPSSTSSKTIPSPFAPKASSLTGLFPKSSSASRLSPHKLSFSRFSCILCLCMSTHPFISLFSCCLLIQIKECEITFCVFLYWLFWSLDYEIWIFIDVNRMQTIVFVVLVVFQLWGCSFNSKILYKSTSFFRFHIICMKRVLGFNFTLLVSWDLRSIWM